MIRVFIAEDHPVVHEGLAHLLRLQGDIVVAGTARTGREAVLAVLRLRPDVVIADVGMPEMNGIEATRQIRARWPGCAVVILSMHGSAVHVFSALEAGARGYVVKERAGGEIVAAVRCAHAGRRYLSPEIAALVACQTPRRHAANPLDNLSRRERETLQLVAEGRSSAAIAKRLNISLNSVSTFRSRLMHKLAIRSIAGLTKFAIRQGLTTLE